MKTKQEEEENELGVNEDNAKEELDESASAIRHSDVPFSSRNRSSN